MASGFIITGRDAAALLRKREWTREQFSFLYSTPAYWPVLEEMGFGDVGRALNAAAKDDRWQDMKGLVSDELIDALVPQGHYGEIVDVLRREYASLVDRLTFPVPEDPAEDGAVAEIVAALRKS